MCRQTRLLVIGPNPGWVQEVVGSEEEYEVVSVQSGADAVTWLDGHATPDLALVDDGVDAFATLARLRALRPYLGVVILSTNNDPRAVVQALKLGAQDFVFKPADRQALKAAIREHARSWRDSEEPEAPGDVELLSDGTRIVTASPYMKRLRAQLEPVAKTHFSALCLGESGVGKEVVARLIHHLSPRAGRPFDKVNCAAMPTELLESELFGYERGAFTGAVRSKPGRFELCHKGTIFLDEIGEMPPALQAKLLHVLQDQQFMRLGSSAPVKVDVRVIAATNVNVRQAIAEKRFREDLYYRLSTFVFSVPPLRERPEDVPVLLRQFVANHAARSGMPPRPVTPSLLARCLEHTWPGNVRELENFAKRYLILGDEAPALHHSDMPRSVARNAGSAHVAGDAPPQNLKAKVRDRKEEMEASEILLALQQTNWNRKAAARLLQISYKSLLLKVQRYGLDRQRISLQPDVKQVQREAEKVFIAAASGL